MNTDKVYTIEEIREILRKSMDYLSENYSVDRFLLFGSYATNQQTPDSDIDLLVSFRCPTDMFNLIDLQDYLANLFKKKIDLGTENSLKNFIKDKILKEAIVL